MLKVPCFGYACKVVTLLVEILGVVITLEHKRKSTSAPRRRVNNAKSLHKSKGRGRTQELPRDVPQGGAGDVVTEGVISAKAPKNAATLSWFVHAV
jgi:hypothetical protein